MKDHKNFLRQKVLAERKSFNEATHLDADSNIIKNVHDVLYSQIADSLDKRLIVGLYWSMVGEPDLLKPAAIRDWLVAIPKIQGERMDFVKYEISSELEMVMSSKLKQPKNNIKMIPNIVVLPGLAFSLSGHRLGFGVGYYDKYFAEMKGSIVKIGVCFHEYLLEYLPHELHDIKMDYIITNETIISL